MNQKTEFTKSSHQEPLNKTETLLQDLLLKMEHLSQENITLRRHLETLDYNHSKLKEEYKSAFLITRNGRVREMVSEDSPDSANPQSNPTMTTTELPVREVSPAYSRVAVSLGMTRSLGDYEFARMDVTVEDFCEKEDKVKTLESVAETAKKFIGKMNSEISSKLDNKAQARRS